MNSEELLRIQLRLEAADGLAQQVGLLPVVDAKVIALGLNAMDGINVEEENSQGGLL
jgi:hypothetical protein